MAKIYTERGGKDSGYRLREDKVCVETGNFDMIGDAHITLIPERDAGQVVSLNEYEEEALYKYLLIRKQQREDRAAEKALLEKFGQPEPLLSDAVVATLATGKTTTVVKAFSEKDFYRQKMELYADVNIVAAELRRKLRAIHDMESRAPGADSEELKQLETFLEQAEEMESTGICMHDAIHPLVDWAES